MTKPGFTDLHGVQKPSAAYAVTHLFNEETTVEREIIEHLKAAKLGWTWRSRDFLKEYRPDEREVLLLPLLRQKLKALNPAVLTDDARVDAIITKLRGCRDNQQWLVTVHSICGRRSVWAS